MRIGGAALATYITVSDPALAIYLALFAGCYLPGNFAYFA
jgi:hypothetical protein